MEMKSKLTEEDYKEIERWKQDDKRGALINFSELKQEVDLPSN